MDIRNKLDKKNIEEIMSLTPMQEGMLFEYISNPNSEKYHEQLSLILSRNVNLELIQRSWDFVIETNEMLRVVYRWQNIDKPVQIILKNNKIPVKYSDFSELSNDETVFQLENIKQTDIKSTLDITQETLRIYLCKISINKYEMIISNHHILYDGWSSGIILKEFLQVYNDLYVGEIPLKKNKNRFKEFIKYNQVRTKSKQKEYWTNYLTELTENVMFSNGRADHIKFVKEYKHIINEDLTKRVNEFLKKEKITLATLLYTVWGVMLQKYKMTDDIIFGTTISGRNEAIKGIEEMVGLFINTLPLRITTNSLQSMREILSYVEKSLNERREYENTAFIEIKEYAYIKPNEELFDSIIVIENYPLDNELNKNSGVLKIDSYEIFDRADYDLVLSVVALFKEIELEFAYEVQLFSEEEMKIMSKNFENVLAIIVENPNIKLLDLEMITQDEKANILYNFNNTKAEYRKDKTINELFEDVVANKPNNIALVYDDKYITYKELNEKANQLARVLKNNGVGKESIVAVISDKSFEMIIAVMGVLKAGGTYLPIDSEYPVDRINYMLKDSEAKILLAQKNLIDNWNFQGDIIDLNDEKLYKGDNSNLKSVNEICGLSYLIYTSGTTGKPKALMTEHKNVLAYLNSFNKLFNLTENDVTLQQASFTFDGFVEEVYSMLIIGGKIILPKNDDVKDVKILKKYIDKYGVTILSCSPLILSEFNSLDKMSTVKTFLSSSDALKKKYYSNIINYSKVYNMYGPTETTVCATCYECKEDEEKEYVPIGKPIENYKVYILDKENKLASIGAVGEICIGGEGVSRGYLNNEFLTEEKFIINPYNKSEKIYRTGDLGRWLLDGNIELIGRRDNQVKIRGYRIEISEIENKLIQHENIKETVVVVREDEDNNKYLSAYIVGDKTFDSNELREYLLKNMPEYMVPQYFVQIDKLPKTLNGKIDKKSLPKEIDNIKISTQYAAPRNEVEEKMVKIWSEILGIEEVGLDDNFFELGGHSLKATTFVAKVYKEFKVEIPLKQIFKTPTIRSVFEYMSEMKEEMYSSIASIPKNEYYKLSSAQKRLYILNKLNGESTNYNMSFAMQLEGKIDKNRIEDIFKSLISRHESLRTCILDIDGEAYQKILEKVDFNLENISGKERTEKLLKNFIKPFNLNKAPLFRAGIIEENNDKYVLITDMHHIIGDGISSEILFRDFTKLYNEENLEELRIQYKDFAYWQNSLFNSEKIKKQEEYWLNVFNKEIPVLNLPTDYVRPAVMSFEGDVVNFELSEELTNKIRKICLDTGISMYMLLMSAYNILLSKYTGQEDVIIGSPIAGRHNSELDNVVGMFVNTFAMRNYPKGIKSYGEFLKEVKDNALKAYENQDYQFEELVSKLNLNKDLSRNALFDTMFVFQNMDKTLTNVKDIKCSPYPIKNNTSKFDIILEVQETNNSVQCTFEYCTKLFKKETIKRMKKHFVNILEKVVENKNIKLSEIEMLSEDEENKLLYEFNNTYAYYPTDKAIHELFEEQVEKTPDNIAVVFEDEKLTYRELNEKSNKLARTLRGKGVKADSIVGIMVERSLEMIVGIMGILKAGGAYLPIDPEYPEERISYMLEDSKTNMLLTESKLISKVSFKGLIIDLEDEAEYDQNIKNLDNINVQKDLAYIIYTSGTTGKPKGTMIEHKNVVRLMFNDKMQFDFNEKDVWTMFHSYCFDFSVWEMYGALLYGGKLVLISKNKARDTEAYLDILRKEKVTVLNQIPTPFYNLMNKELDSNNNELKLRYVIFGGEALKPEMLKRFIKKYPETKLINMYGITETTVHVTFKEIKEKDINLKISNIGKPIPTLSTYIMDKNLKLQPIGVPGELCVGGEGVARGYLNKEKLTEEKFIINPYKKEEKIYRSGDLARMLSNGEMEYLGRIDHQVKIRGFRIELGEIETQLLNYEEVKETIVIDREDKNGAKYLCAYIVCHKELTVGELREYLSKELPEYMIPSYFIQLEKMPLTHNGKIDRTSLPEPEGNIVTGTEYEGARNEVEEKLIEIWGKILGVENIGINHNFFELGGHSLKATSLISKIHKELNVEVPLKEIFKTPTIKGISEYIQSTEKNIYEEIKKVEEKEYYEVSSAQKRMYMIQQLDLQSTSYNMPGVLEVNGKLDIKRLKNAFNKLIERHETLRTSFENIEGEIVQKISKEIDFKVDYVDISKIIEEVALNKEIISLDSYKNEKIKNEEIERLISNFVKAFNLRKAPLLRVAVIKIHKTKHIIMFDMHHIISDGVSIGILIKEFVKLYDDKKLEKIKVQYKDFSVWQNNLLKSEKMKKQQEYWLQNFNDEIPVLNMPTDFTRPSVQSIEGDNISFKLDKQLTSDLNKIAKETGSTMYMVLLSGINILLSKYSGQEDIVIGSPIAGRPHADLEKIIGMFVNTLAMRNYPEGSKSYEEFLKEVKGNALRAYENQDYQFEQLVDSLNLRRDISRNPLFDVMLTMQNMKNNKIEINELLFKTYDNSNKTAKFDLLFTSSEIEEELEISIEYCTKLFEKQTIENMIEHLKNIFKIIVNDKNIKLNEIDMLTKDEKNKLLYEFNDSKMNYAKEKTIHQLFEQQVKKTPNDIALVFEDENLTYIELNKKANKLAKTLRKKGIKPDEVIALMVERSINMIVCIIAILKSGAACLPIDPEYPLSRKKYMLEDSKVKILLCERELIEKLDFQGEIIDLYDKNLYIGQGENLDNVNKCSDLLYVIYTSGSTGMPKGVMIEHKTLVNLISYEFSKTNINFKSKVLQFTTISFDVSYQEIFSTLLSGGELYLINNNTRKDINKLIDFIEYRKIKIIFLPTSYFKFIMSEYEHVDKLTNSVNNIIVAGEQLVISENSINLIRKKGVSLYNHYGPSETHVVTTYTIDGQTYTPETIPIGKPISNTTIYILNDSLKLIPIGCVGQLYISGDCVGRGYINKIDLTKEKFIENPFAKGEKMYKTGDLARWLSDGNIEFLGRIDHQVKIRGFRIELGEIENQLLKYDGIKEVVVVDKNGKSGDKHLCSYIVCNKDINIDELKEYLFKNLPEYMIPSYFIKLEKMPLTPNGKIDRKVLPEPEENMIITQKYEAPRNESEEKLVLIWREVLGIETIGINHNFFELGGHSLKATVLISKIHKELNVEIPLKEIFKSPSIKGISAYIQSKEKNKYEEIKKVEEKEYYEVSSAQKRMYMLQQFDLQSTSYNMPGVLEVQGNLSVKRLEDAFNKLVERHETLRTSFENIEGKIVQKIITNIKFKIDYINISETLEEVLYKEKLNSAKKCNEKLINEEIDNQTNNFMRAFDLRKAPLLRVGVIKIEETKHLVMFDMHHIISDGVSMGILIKEFTELYDGKDLEKMKVQYKDFSEWQNNLIKSEKIKNQEKYWLQRFSDEIPILNMPTDFIRPSVQSFEGDSVSLNFDKELTSDLKKIAKETGSTMYMVLLSGLSILLSKYSGDEDIIIGSPIAGRSHADLEKIIGMFVNTLAIRTYPIASKTYEEFLKAVKEDALKAYENQEYQFEELVDKLNLRRNISRNPLFDVMFTMQNIDIPDIKLADLSFKNYSQDYKIAKFDLAFSASEVGEEIFINVQYCNKLFKKNTVERMLRYFKNIFKVIVKDIKINISEIEMLLEEEKHKLLYQGNDTSLNGLRSKTIHELFEEQVEKTPNNIAVVFEDMILSYSQLNEKSNRLARTLRKKGVKADTIIGMIVERSLDMIIGIMAILKAGGAYLPIDSDYPEERKKYMLEDSSVKILLTQECLLEDNTFIKSLSGVEVLNLEAKELYKEEGCNLENKSISSDLAYIIYTSGSTGKPKGVMVEHRNLVNLIFALSKVVYGKFDYCVNVSMLSPYYFDASVKQIFPTITLGHTLFIVPKNIIFDGTKLYEFYNKNLIEIADGTPVHMNMLCSENYEDETRLAVKYFLIGGDMLTSNLVNMFFHKFNKSHSSIINVYGPTECCDVTTTYIVDSVQINSISIPIGKPILNTKVYILDKNLKVCPKGILGELYISGEGVSRGYLNKEKLTLEKFVENPFVKGQRMYSTGDLVRWLDDENIECLGRVDKQVKVRGFRIELGEIENVLLSNDNIKEAVVITKEDNSGVKYLCAYVVYENELAIGELREYLLKYLPEYMIPTYFVQLEEMPITQNGKIDRKVLLEHRDSMIIDVKYEKPRNKIEENLIKIWREVLEIDELGINNNFFEMGGHSLKAVNAVGKIHKELEVKVPLREIFKLPTIKELSRYIEEVEKSKYNVIQKTLEREYYPLSRAQKRLFIMNQLSKKDLSYNMPLILMVEGVVDIFKLENSIKKFIDRHEVFRTYFKFINGDPVQIINNNYNFNINVINVKNNDVENIVKELIMPFELDKVPLLRVNYIVTETGVQILMMDMHHIISDGISNQIIIREISDIYKGNDVKELDIQYKDFSVWQSDYLNSEYMKKLESYWEEKLEGFSYTNLNKTYEIINGELEGIDIPIIFDKEQYFRIDNFCKKNSVTKFSYFVAILNIILMNEINKSDITIGIPVAGRNHEQLQNLIGLFLNVLPIRIIIKKNDNFKDYLGMVNETLIEALNNQDYPYEELYDLVTEKHGIENESLFSIMLNYMPYEGSEKEKENIKVENVNFKLYKNEKIVPKYDVTFYVKENKDNILINMVYKKSLFEEYIMERIAESFTYISDVVLNNELIFINEIEYSEIISEEQIDDDMDDYFENEGFFIN